MKSLWILPLIAAALSACSTSPLYKGDPSSGYGTVPRDEMGEPIWDAITPRKREDDGYEFGNTNASRLDK